MFDFRPWLDFLFFNACWFGTAYGVSSGYWALGPCLVCFSVAAHLFYSRLPVKEGLFIITVSTLGYLLDSGLQVLNVLTFQGSFTRFLAPVWLFFQWFAFSLLFEHSLTWLRQQRLKAAFLGALGGPLSYYAAESFALLQFSEPLIVKFILFALAWALFFPLILAFSERLHSTRFPNRSEAA